MDVVRTNIGAIHGEVDVESRPGQGTTITLRIPLTLAIIDGLLVAVGEETYLFNIDSVLECGDDIIWREDSRTGTFPFRDELIPLVCLRSVFGLPPRPGITNQLVVAKSAKQKVGILVDRILGQYQTVIKPLTDGFRKSPAVSGAAILGDGSIAMILEINKLISSFV
jgi:two-component system chemotaxis sensor kinase CheA